MILLSLALAIISTAMGQVLYKLFFLRQNKFFLISSIGCFCIAPVMSYTALMHLSLSTVYIATGLTYVLVLILAKLLLDETIGPRKIQAMLLIVGGVIVFNL